MRPAVLKAITSRENPAFRSMARLAASAPERRKRGLTVLDGVHLVGAFVDAGHAIDSAVVSQSALDRDEVARLVARLPAPKVTIVSDKLFETLSTVDSATGILAAAAAPPGRPVPFDAPLVLLVEDVQDPGNVGTLLRSAAAAGAAHALLSRGCAFAWSLKTVRAGMGAHFSLNIAEDQDLPAFAQGYKGQVVALSGDATRSLYDIDLRGPVAIAVGSEGAGISPRLRQAAGVAARIPMPGKVESLNAAVAASIALFEVVRQQGKARGGP
ncbi:MAG TPA: RNA methyltransferase [Usitatibacter sp.]|nr:RNA methyltransferase [Usitatibacter sp.]